MMKMRAILFLLLLAWPASAQADPPRVVLMGDSQVQGIDREMARLSALQHFPYKAVLIGGSSVSYWAQPKTSGWDIRPRWKEIRDFKPDIVLVSLGSNDSYFGPQKVRDSVHTYLATFVNMVLDTGPSRIVWIGPPKLARALAGEAAFYSTLASENSGSIFEIFDSRDVEIQMELDKLHATYKGSRKWAQLIWARVQPPQEQWGQ